MMPNPPRFTVKLRSARCALLLLGFWASIGRADEGASQAQPGSRDARRAIAGFRIPAGLRVELFAAEPLVANPVAFTIDHRNRFYVAETFRLHHGVTDTRNHMDWLDDDLACRTIADRVAMYRKFLTPADFDSYGPNEDRVRRLEDRDGDGTAEVVTILADGFRGPETGLGAGLLVQRDSIWYTNVPDLWRLRDTNDDGRADQRQSLQSGYGVHVGFLGHDLHGLTWGPDERLYFSVGDRGLNVTTVDGKRLEQLDSGSILRCDPDGTNLEIYATGLRNPQELAFNEWGDLFTCDNNSDGGDRARWVHLVEGGDSGWRIGYQFIEHPGSRGPWNAEKLWQPRPENTAAYLLPPIANLSDGPSGLTYHPGVAALPDSLKGTFFLADFRGSAANSGLRTIQVRPSGASYELVAQRRWLWGLEATDVDFGPDGALYVSDWVEGWDQPGKGRIYRVTEAERPTNDGVTRVRTILAEGMSQRPLPELADLLAHPDMRVRRDAQFELVDRARRDRQSRTSLAAEAVLTAIAFTGNSPLARRHAAWGLGRLHRDGSDDAGRRLIALLSDRDPEIRAQTARALTDSGRRIEAARAPLIALLQDESARVRFHAALALGKLGGADAIPGITQMLRDNNGDDRYLQHAAVQALVEIGSPEALEALASDPSPAVRLGALLAGRRLGSARVAAFLTDPDPRLVMEAARAISDAPIPAAMPELARLPVTESTSPFLVRRVIAANERTGGAESSRALADLAARGDLEPALRVEALEALSQWPSPSGRDRIVGLWRPIGERSREAAVSALLPRLPELLSSAPDPVRAAASRAAAQLKIGDIAPTLIVLVEDASAEPNARAEALRALAQLKDPRLAETAAKAADNSVVPLRAEGLRVLAELQPDEALRRVQPSLDSGSLPERRSALEVLGLVAAPEAGRRLAQFVERLDAGEIEPELRLDVLLAARASRDDSVRDALRRYESHRPKGDPLAAFRESEQGGDADRGRTIFREKAAVSCLRCHKHSGNGGEVGPDLTEIGKKNSREYLLEAIVAPNARIAEGFDSLVLALTDGQVVGGIVKGQHDGHVTLITAEGHTLSIAESDIEERKRGPSAMPEDLATRLSPTELRDLVEFLATSR